MSQALILHGILSYPHLFVARAINKGDDPKYSTGLLIAKNDPQLMQLNQAVELEKASGFPQGFPDSGKVCIKDCAVQFPDRPELAGYFYIASSTGANSKPPVVGMDRLPIMDQSLVFAGAMAYVAVNIAFYNNPLNKGITSYLQSVMIDGTEGPLGRLDGRPSVETLFASVPQQPVTPQLPGSVQQPQMTAKAAGTTYESFIQSGWTDQDLRLHGYII